VISNRPYWRVHVPDEDPLSTLTLTCPSANEDRAEVSADAVRAHAELIGLPEGRAVHGEVSPLAGPDDPQDKPGSL
jgi:hypothetical protein